MHQEKLCNLNGLLKFDDKFDEAKEMIRMKKLVLVFMLLPVLTAYTDPDCSDFDANEAVFGNHHHSVCASMQIEQDLTDKREELIALLKGYLKIANSGDTEIIHNLLNELDSFHLLNENYSEIHCSLSLLGNYSGMSGLNFSACIDNHKKSEALLISEILEKCTRNKPNGDERLCSEG